MTASGFQSGELGIADLLRAFTRELHATAEHAGVIKEILRGRISIYEYALFLRNLIPVYRALEAGLTRHRRTSGVGQLYQPAVFRSEALESDLRAIVGVSWEQSLPLLAAADRYAQRVTSAADGSGGGLISHAYVRYLGDLIGGQVLQVMLSRVLGLRVSALAFYEFPLICDLQAFKSDYRRLVVRFIKLLTKIYYHHCHLYS